MFSGNTGLYTDFYELSMAQGYFYWGRKNETASFDYFFRKNPFGGGYVIFAGIYDLLNALKEFSFSDEDIAYLKQQGFRKEFLAYLKRFKFSAKIISVAEGEVVFPNEPVLRVEGNIIETQLAETIILNILNFESLIATKASRIKNVTGDRMFTDFGLRRAQGWGGILASRSAIIGGADSTSNVYAGFKYGLKLAGTQAHSWIQSFGDELTAFRKYAEIYPDNCTLLVDTYDTLKSGIPNAIKVAKELRKEAYELKGIRLDSGDFAVLSKKARRKLDEAGFPNVIIIASNQLDEFAIEELNKKNAPIDAFGIGTELITGRPSAALDGVYKLSSYNDEPSLKISDSKEKITLPGIKNILRFKKNNEFFADLIVLYSEKNESNIYNFNERTILVNCDDMKAEEIQKIVFDGEKIAYDIISVTEISEFSKKRLSLLPDNIKKLKEPGTYKSGISAKLFDLREKIIHNITT